MKGPATTFARFSASPSPGRILRLGLLLMLLSQPLLAQHLSLFGNTGYREDSDQSYDQDPFIYSLDFFYAAQVSDHLSVQFEFVAEHSWVHQDADVERLNLTYHFSDETSISAGRFHTPIGYWNSTMHHGRILHDFAERPFFMEYDHDPEASSILPNHIVGFILNRSLEARDYQLDFQLHLSDAQEVDSAEAHHDDPHHKPEYDAPNRFDLSNTPGLGLRSTYSSKNADWSAGLSVFHHTLIEAGSQDEGALAGHEEELVEQTIVGAEWRWQHERYSASAEAYHFRNRDQITSTGSHSALAYYAQAGFTMTPDWRLSYRYSTLDFDDDDLFFQLLDSEEQTHHIISLRYDISDFHVLKLELDHSVSDIPRLNHRNVVRLQWAFFHPFN